MAFFYYFCHRMTIKKNLIASFIFAILVSGIIIYKMRTQNNAPEIPFFQYDLLDEEQNIIKTEQLKGQVIVVSYFQTWCSDCVKEQPELLKLQEHFKDKDFKILMVTDEPFEKISLFKNKFKSQLDFYQLKEPIKSIGIARFPTTYLIDQKGNVVESKVEGIEWFTPTIVKTIEGLF